jgi:hypothetical protein
VALILCHTNDWIATLTRTSLTSVSLSARIPVIASRSISLLGVAAQTRRRVTGASGVTLVGGHTGDWVGTYAGAALAGIRLSAGVPIIAGRSIRSSGIATFARSRITSASTTAWPQRRAHHGVAAHTISALAGISLRAQVAVAASGTIRLVLVSAESSRGVAYTELLARSRSRTCHRRTCLAETVQAVVANRASITVAARRGGRSGIGSTATSHGIADAKQTDVNRMARFGSA